MRPNRIAQSSLIILSEPSQSFFDSWENKVWFQCKNELIFCKSCDDFWCRKQKKAASPMEKAASDHLNAVAQLQSIHSRLAQAAAEVTCINALNARFMLVDDGFHYSFHHTIWTIRMALQSCIEQLGAHIGVLVPVAGDVESFVLCHMYQ